MNTARAGTLAGVTVAAGAAVLSGPLALSVPGGLLLAFVLPGTALVEAVFRPGRRDIGVAERLVLIPALSLAVLVLGGLGLWAIGGSLNRAGWLSIAAAVTLVALGAAVARARPAPAAAGSPVTAGSSTAGSPATAGSRTTAGSPTAAGSPGAPDSSAAPATPSSSAVRLGGAVLKRRLVRDVLPLTLAVALLAGIGWWSFADSEKTYDITVTTLSAAPPGAADADGNRQVQVSAGGLAPEEGPYRLVTTGAESGELSDENLTPDTGGDWTGWLSLPSEERVTVDLFRAGDASALRTVIIAAAP